MLDLIDHTYKVVLGTSLYYGPLNDHFQNGNFLSVRYVEDTYYHDPLIADLVNTEFRSPLFPLLENYGHSDESQSNARESLIVGFPPSGHDFPSRLTKLYTLSNVNRFLSGASDDKVDANEKSVAHVNLEGRVHVGAVESPLVGGPNSAYLGRAIIDPSVPDFSFDFPLAGVINLPTERDYSIVARILEKSKAGLYTYTVFPGINVGVKDIRFSYVGDNLTGISYTIINSGWGLLEPDGYTPYLTYKEIRVGRGFLWATKTTTPSDGAIIYQRYGPRAVVSARTIRHYNRNEDEAPSWYVNSSFGPRPETFPSPHGDSDWWCWTCSSTPQRGWQGFSGISGELGYRKVDSGTNSFLRFRRTMSLVSSELLPLGFLAQSDAYDTHFQILTANLVEFMSEVGDISSLITSPLSIIELARTSYKQTSHILKGFLDILSDTTLFYSFMLAPNVKLAEEMSAKADRLSRIFDTFYGYQTIRGKATYALGYEIPELIGSIAVGRAKMRVRVPPDTLWSVVLPLEKLHLLPDLSNYWETLRLSFVVDWFFNVQSKLNIVDKTIKFMALDMGQTVNSVTLYKPIVPVVETDFTVEKDTSYVYHCRYVLPSFQVFTPTRLDLLAGRGVPSWLTAGSLFYKLS